MPLNRSHVIARLERARDYLKTERWTRHQLCKAEKNGVSVCALGALYIVDPKARVVETEDGKALDWYHGNTPLVTRCAEELAVTAFKGTDREEAINKVADFNDLRARDKRDVVRLFDKTIKRLKASA